MPNKFLDKFDRSIITGSFCISFYNSTTINYGKNSKWRLSFYLEICTPLGVIFSKIGEKM